MSEYSEKFKKMFEREICHIQKVHDGDGELVGYYAETPAGNRCQHTTDLNPDMLGQWMVTQTKAALAGSLVAGFDNAGQRDDIRAREVSIKQWRKEIKEREEWIVETAAAIASIQAVERARSVTVADRLDAESPTIERVISMLDEAEQFDGMALRLRTKPTPRGRWIDIVLYGGDHPVFVEKKDRNEGK